MRIGFSISLVSPSGHNINQIQTSSKSSWRNFLHFSGKKVQHPYSYSLLQKVPICSFTQNHPPIFSSGMLLHSITCSNQDQRMYRTNCSLQGFDRMQEKFNAFHSNEDKVGRRWTNRWWWWLMMIPAVTCLYNVHVPVLRTWTSMLQFHGAVPWFHCVHFASSPPVTHDPCLSHLI